MGTYESSVSSHSAMYEGTVSTVSSPTPLYTTPSLSATATTLLSGRATRKGELPGSPPGTGVYTYLGCSDCRIAREADADGRALGSASSIASTSAVKAGGYPVAGRM